MRKALAADLEEALGEDLTRNSPKSLIPGTSIKANGAQRYNESTPRSVDSMDSQSNERSGSHVFDSRESKVESRSQWSRPGAAKVPALWNHGETPRADNITSYPSQSTSDLNFPEDPLKNPTATSGWIAINPESSSQHNHAHKSSPDSGSVKWNGISGKVPNSELRDKLKTQDIFANGARHDFRKRDNSTEPAPKSGGTAGGTSRAAPAEPTYPSEGGGRTNTISPMEVSIAARIDPAISSGWAPIHNSRSSSSSGPLSGPGAGAGAPDGIPALRHSSSSSFVPIRTAANVAPAPAPRLPSAALESSAGRISDAGRQSRALSDPVRGSYLEEFAAASSDLKVANATVEVQRQLIHKLEARSAARLNPPLPPSPSSVKYVTFYPCEEGGFVGRKATAQSSPVGRRSSRRSDVAGPRRDRESL